MVLGHAQCQMAFYVQQKAFELQRPRPNQPLPDPNRPANVRLPTLIRYPPGISSGRIMQLEMNQQLSIAPLRDQ